MCIAYEVMLYRLHQKNTEEIRLWLRMMFMPRSFSIFRSFAVILLASSAIGACGQMHKEVPQKDVQRIFDEMKGPELEGVEATLLESAEQAEQRGNYATAAQFYKQISDKHPDEGIYRFNYADSLRRAGEYAQAATEFRKLTDDKAVQLQAMEGLGLSQMALGEFDLAGDTLADVMDKDTTRWRTINAIGILFTIKGMYPEARQYFAEGLAQNPKSVAVRNNMALMEAFDHQYDEAIRLLTEARRMAGRNQQEQKQSDMNLALVYAIKGDLENAERTARQHLDEAQLLNNMGYYAHLAKDDVLARSYLNMALTSSDKHYEKAWQNLETLNKLVKNAPRR